MSDALEKSSGCSSSSLAVVEKKTQQRHGGCVGIFFQLFDWNRRFAKKKFFSKKLLPPDRLKRSSKKFGGDEKQAKIRLIADENKGGFPSVKNSNLGSNSDADHKHEMRVPGLVARLMGLESMPTMHRDKAKKVITGFVNEEKFGSKEFGAREEFGVEKVGIKHELRPPKLQKTSVPDRQAIARFGAEKLPPFKNVLLKSRKHHHHHHHQKLPTPVKSPRSGLKKGSSKLIGAATRILEPGLQASRSKCTLSYANASDRSARNGAMEIGACSVTRQLEACDGLKGQQCRNCGYLLDDLDSKLMQGERAMAFASPFSHCVGSSCQGLDINKPGRPVFYPEVEAESCEAYPVCAANEIHNAQPHVKFEACKSPLRHQNHRHSGNQPDNALQDMPASFGSNHKVRSENQIQHPRDNVNGAKNFVSMSQSFRSMRSQVPARRDNGKFDSEKRVANRLNETVPPGRKRRPTNISRHGESSSFVNCTVDDQNNSFAHQAVGKQPGYNVRSINNQRNRNRAAADDGDSFAYNSSVKVKSGMVKNDLHFAESLRHSASGDRGRRKRLEKPVPLSGDALGALLEQKLKELTCHEDGTGGNVPRKTTAAILHELISALTSEVPFQPDDVPAMSDGRYCWHNQSHSPGSTPPSKSQASVMATKMYANQRLDSEHLSPGSVLEAYFSNDSCPSSSSIDDCHGYKALAESIECSFYGQQSPNSEQLDSAASIKMPKSSKGLVVDIVNNVSEALCCSKLASCGLNGGYLDQAMEVLSNAELVFHDAARPFPVRRLLTDELEALVSVLWMNFGCALGIEDGKEANQLTKFALDSVVEHLGSRFGVDSTPVPKVLQRPPLWSNAHMLILEIVEAVRQWEEVSKYTLDELIMREMSRALAEWTESEAEALETGAEICQHLYQNLVDEIVTDLSNR